MAKVMLDAIVAKFNGIFKGCEKLETRSAGIGPASGLGNVLLLRVCSSPLGNKRKWGKG